MKDAPKIPDSAMWQRHTAMLSEILKNQEAQRDAQRRELIEDKMLLADNNSHLRSRVAQLEWELKCAHDSLERLKAEVQPELFDALVMTPP